METKSESEKCVIERNIVRETQRWKYVFLREMEIGMKRQAARGRDRGNRRDSKHYKQDP